MARKFRDYKDSHWGRGATQRAASRENKTNLLKRIFSVILLSIASVSWFVLLLTLCSPYVAPSWGWIFPLLGLLAPATYVVNVIFALYYVVRWRWRPAILFMLLLGVGAFSVSLYLKIPITKDYGLDKYKGCVKFMTYNIRNFIGDDGQWSTANMADYLDGSKADVICLQEFNGEAKDLKRIFATVLKRYKLVQHNSMAILSRYPIINSWDLLESEESINGSSIAADIVVNKDTIRLFNNHLHTTAITAKDDNYLRSSEIMMDTLRREKLHGIVSRFGNSSAERVRQVSLIREQIGQSPYKYVVCGDFNDTPMSYAYHRLSEGLTDAFQRCGDGYSYTYRGFANVLRIDYILTSEGIEPRSYLSDTECYLSDHLPVISHLKIAKSSQK